MRKLNIKKFVFLFTTTLILGGMSVIITTLILGWEHVTGVREPVNEVITGGIWLFAVGLTFSVISQMGFFAYLTIHRLGLGLFKSHKLWNRVQVILISFVFFDWVYFRYIAFGESGQTWMNYLLLPSVLLLISLAGAYLKAKDTYWFTFIPAVFFLFVVTSIEMIPALTINDQTWIILMLVPLVVCNLWQLLILHRLTGLQDQKSA